MTTAETVDYSNYVGKRVTLVRNVEGDNGPEAVELTGTIENANPLGIVFKPKGKTSLELFEIGEIEPGSVRLAEGESGPAQLKARTLKPVKPGQARSHLLERHGGTLTEVNGMSENEAYSFHEGIDHVAADLGHVHSDGSDSKE